MLIKPLRNKGIPSISVAPIIISTSHIKINLTPHFFSLIMPGVSYFLLILALTLVLTYFLDSFGLPGVCLNEIKNLEEILMEREDLRKNAKWEDEELYSATKTLLNALNVRSDLPLNQYDNSDSRELIFAAKQFLKVLNK
jgi:hypothetical protein